MAMEKEASEIVMDAFKETLGRFMESVKEAADNKSPARFGLTAAQEFGKVTAKNLKRQLGTAKRFWTGGKKNMAQSVSGAFSGGISPVLEGMKPKYYPEESFSRQFPKTVAAWKRFKMNKGSGLDFQGQEKEASALTDLLAFRNLRGTLRHLRFLKGEGGLALAKATRKGARVKMSAKDILKAMKQEARRGIPGEAAGPVALYGGAGAAGYGGYRMRRRKRADDPINALCKEASDNANISVELL